jgi:hypothetical protein
MDGGQQRHGRLMSLYNPSHVCKNRLMALLTT